MMARWLPLLLYSALIFYLSSAPTPEFAKTNIQGADKVLHVGAFSVWGFLCSWALAGNCPGLSRRWFVLIVTAAGALYGFSDEIHQSFVVDRVADPWDLLADLGGSLLGVCVALAWMNRSRGKLDSASEPPQELSYGEKTAGNGSRNASG